MFYQKKDMTPRGASWNLQGVRMSTAAKLKNWTWVIPSLPGTRNPFRDTGAAKQCMDGMQSMLKTIGMQVDNYRQANNLIQLASPWDPNLTKFLTQAPGKPNEARLVFCILPTEHKDVYNAIKRAGDLKRGAGVHTICVVGSKFAKDNPQYYANVAMKFNIKLGGINQMVDGRGLHVISEDKTMVVGLDVTHPSPGSCKIAPIIAGIVASTDKWLNQFPGMLRIQNTPKDEMCTELGELLKSRLRVWKKGHSNFPENILVYRDGVSEGQYDLVLQHELTQMRAACAESYPAPETKKGLPRITIIIVGKRHHTRFFPLSADQASKSSNPKNGTVVDRGVTEARNWHFYLQAHNALQGTARPAHYFVIWDEIFSIMKPKPPFKNMADVVEDLTHNMCYLFPRATKAVSICPPAYLADLICERGRVYLQRLYDPKHSEREGQHDAQQAEVEIHPNLADTMFYL